MPPKQAGQPTDDLYGAAIQPRLAALQGIFGTHQDYMVSPIPFYLGGDPTVVGFHDRKKSTMVYCTSEMTGGWGSGQRPGPMGESEFAIVVPIGSPLGPRSSGNRTASKGWTGVVLAGMCKFSRDVLLKHGETTGPIPAPNAFSPHNNFLFIELAGGRVPFEYGGRKYGLLLLMSISDAEFEYRKLHGAEDLIQKLKASGAFPITDPSRPSVV